MMNLRSVVMRYWQRKCRNYLCLRDAMYNKIHIEQVITNFGVSKLCYF